MRKLLFFAALTAPATGWAQHLQLNEQECFGSALKNIVGANQ